MNKYRLIIIYMSIIMAGLLFYYYLIFSGYIVFYSPSFINIISLSIEGLFIDLIAILIYLLYQFYKEKKRKQVKKE